MMRETTFNAPPTVARFMNSEARFRLIAGPVGSGKTAGCIMELLKRATLQAPGRDGMRRTRFAIVRQTLKQIKDTVLKDILQWLDGLCDYKVSEGVIYVQFGNVRSEWLLIPLDEPKDVRRLLSMQLTGAWMSEAIEMDTEVISPLIGRCGRYPSNALRPDNHAGEWPTWYGVIADTNMPEEGSSWHELMEVNTPSNYQVFIQPGGMEPNAENIENLPGKRRYYIEQLTGKSKEWIDRYIHAKYGTDPSGTAVFKSTFIPDFHVRKLTPEQRADGQRYAINVADGMPLIIAQDFGRNPCSLICQPDHMGGGHVLEEVVAKDIGLEQHLRLHLMPKLRSERYFGRPVYMIGDPKGRDRSTVYEETTFDVVKRAGLNAYPAPTNDIDKRLRAVEALLLQQRQGRGALLIDGDLCPTLVLALKSRYRFAKRLNGELQAKPEKLHPWSDLADDLQYFCLVIQGGLHNYIAARIAREQRAVAAMASGPRQRISARGWT
jgi:hypothetical protein